MCEHEKKACPRCNKNFECKVGSILLCQCSVVALTLDELDFIRNNYDDCLCADCMKEMKAAYHHGKYQEKVRQISRLF